MAKIFERSFNDYSKIVVGDRFTNETSYIIGYWEAGDILVDMALTLNNSRKDRLFFPICNNYRQFIELCLKQLISDAEEIYCLLELNNMQIKKCKEKIPNENGNTHNIAKLLNRLVTILECITKEGIGKDVKKTILDFHNMDKTDQKFRYPKSTQGQIHFRLREDFDIENVKNTINDIGNYLMGIDAYLYDFGNFVKAEIAEIEGYYNYEYEHQENYF